MKTIKLIGIIFASFFGIIMVLGILASVIIPKLAETRDMANLPKCSDPETVQLVKQIVSDNQLLSTLYADNKAEDLKLDMIRTVKKDKDIEMYTCKAKIDFGKEIDDNPVLATAFSSITYTVSLTDDKKQFIVELQSE
jgi:hypothetical protein